MITERTLLVFADWRPVFAITNPRFDALLPELLIRPRGAGPQAGSGEVPAIDDSTCGFSQACNKDVAAAL
jgi:hypothetical protein